MAEGRKSLWRPADALLVVVLCAAVSAAPQVVGGAEVFLELIRPHAASARAIKASNIARGSVSYDGGEEDRWIVTNPYLPSDRNFFSMIYDAACAPDGTLLIADGYNNRVRTVNGSRLTDWLGMQGDRGEKDINGPARGASLRRPGGLCVTGDGTVFVAPAAPRSSPLRKVDGKTRAVSTWVY